MPTLSRRDFTRLFALSGSAAVVGPLDGFPESRSPSRLLPPIAPAPTIPEEQYWIDVRRRFVLPAELGNLNAANLCPASLPTIEALSGTSAHWTRTRPGPIEPGSGRRGK